jgi:hypothetical protein
MIRMILTAMVLLPAAASACELMAAMPQAHAGGHGCGAMSVALMAAVAALGVWVLRSVEKDGVAVKRTGQVVGWVLAVVGLAGVLCGVAAHAAKKKSQCCNMPSGAPAAADTNTKLPPGHPPIGSSQK